MIKITAMIYRIFLIMINVIWFDFKMFLKQKNLYQLILLYLLGIVYENRMNV
jgi:hypothetical protein